LFYFKFNDNIRGFVKSLFYPLFVIPAKAGIQLNQEVLDSRLRGSDGFFDFLRFHQNWVRYNFLDKEEIPMAIFPVLTAKTGPVTHLDEASLDL